MSALGKFNRVFQWTGFRLAKEFRRNDLYRWSLYGPVWPLTGWNTDYRPVFRHAGVYPISGWRSRSEEGALSWLT